MNNDTNILEHTQLYKKINDIQSQNPLKILYKNTTKGFNILCRGIKRNGLKLAIILLILFIIIGIIYAYPIPIDGSYQDNATPGQRIASLFIIAALTSVITMTLTIFDSENERNQEKDIQINEIKCKYNEFILTLSKKYLRFNIDYILKKEILDDNIYNIYLQYIINIFKYLKIDKVKKYIFENKNKSKSITPLLDEDLKDLKDLNDIKDIKEEYFLKINEHLYNRIKILYIYNLILNNYYLSDLYLQVLKELDNIFYDRDWNINENIKLKEENIVKKLKIIKNNLINIITNNTIDKNIINKCSKFYINDLNDIFNETKPISKFMFKETIETKSTEIYNLIKDNVLNKDKLLSFINKLFKTVCKINNESINESINESDNNINKNNCTDCKQ